MPPTFRCQECGTILREIMAAWRTDAETLNTSGRDPLQLRNEWLAADEFQARELHQTHYPRTIEARRRQREHEILTSHTVILHGAWTSGLGPRWPGDFGTPR